MNRLNKFLRICLLPGILSFIFFCSSIYTNASTVENTVSDAFVQIDFGESITFTEEYHIHFTLDQDKIELSIPIEEEDSTHLIQSVTLAEQNTEKPLFITAAKIEEETKEQTELAYQIKIDENQQNMQVEIFYGFKAGQNYILRITMNRMNCLQKSADSLFIEYPISYPHFAANADQFLFEINLPEPISKDEYKMQAVAETWFKENSRKSDHIQYISKDFHFRDQQKIYTMLPADTAATFPINRPDLTDDDFFPNAEQTILKSNLWGTALQKPSLTVSLAGFMFLLALFVCLFIERKIMFGIDELPLDLSIFELDAAHAGMLYAMNKHSSLLLAGLLQLVQKNELSLDRTTFYWLHPEREDFGNLSSSEVFLLQWLFPIKENNQGERTAFFSVEKLKMQVHNRVWAQEYSENFNRYLHLLRNDLFAERYLSKERRNLGRNIYKGIFIFCLVLPIILFFTNQSSLNLLFVIPILFALYRYRRGRYFTLKGKRKWKQLHLLKVEMQTMPVLFKKLGVWLKMRDIAPLLLPYAVSYNHLESFLKQIGQFKKAKVGIIDLFNTQADYAKVDKKILEQNWRKAKNDMLFMYYVLEASFVEAEIIRQETLMKFDDVERK